MFRRFLRNKNNSQGLTPQAQENIKQALIRENVQRIISDEIVNSDSEELTELKDGEESLSFKEGVTQEQKEKLLNDINAAITPDSQEKSKEYAILARLIKEPQEFGIGNQNNKTSITRKDIRAEAISQLTNLFKTKENPEPFSSIDISKFKDNAKSASLPQQTVRENAIEGENNLNETTLNRVELGMRGISVNQAVDALSSPIIGEALDNAINIVQSSEGTNSYAIFTDLTSQDSPIARKIDFVAGIRKIASEASDNPDPDMPQNFTGIVQDVRLIETVSPGDTIEDTKEMIVDSFQELKDFAANVSQNKQEILEQWQQNEEIKNNLQTNFTLGVAYDSFSYLLEQNTGTPSRSI